MTIPRKTIIFAAGGTGGHIFPALTIARKFNKISKDYDILFIGGGSELEKRLMSNVEFNYEVVKSTGVVGKGLGGRINFLKNLFAGFFKLRKIYRLHNTALIIGFGGYPTVIPILVAAIQRLPVFIFEQNSVAGVANKFLAYFATEIFKVPISKNIPNSFKKYKNVTTVLNPVRPEIKKVKPWELQADGQTLRILVIGGSQGAKSLNDTIIGLKDFFLNQAIHLTHQTGKVDFLRVKTAYQDQVNLRAVEFIEDMHSVLSRTDLIICRAGAGAVSEVTQTKIPAIFVPLPISHGHQKYNVIHLVEGNAVKMFPQDGKLLENLKMFILRVCDNREILADMNSCFSTIPELAGVEDGADVISRKILSKVSN